MEEINEVISRVGKALCVGAAFSGKAEFLQVPFLYFCETRMFTSS